VTAELLQSELFDNVKLFSIKSKKIYTISAYSVSHSHSPKETHFDDRTGERGTGSADDRDRVPAFSWHPNECPGNGSVEAQEDECLADTAVPTFGHAPDAGGQSAGRTVGRFHHDM